MTTLRRVFVANRGEIAMRILRACRTRGVETVLAVSEADRESLPARIADRVLCVGGAPAKESYLRAEALVHAARATGCDALHPGYGFLAENAQFAERCETSEITFIGPRSATIRALGDKLAARALATRCGIPLLPGSQQVASAIDALEIAQEIGYPVLLKAAAGGGGRGMKVATDADALRDAFDAATAEALAAFGNGTLYLERFVPRARHVEVQILGDGAGGVLHLGERDCSAQRRYQKIVEEAPAPALAPGLRDAIHAAAVTLARAADYRSAGTVEFLVDASAGRFYFLEVNTRIQVEHPVTEMITGIDIVAEQLRIASGDPLALRQSDIRATGHAIEVRINAEDPATGFRPSPGFIQRWDAPSGDGIRVDTHCYAGYRVPPFYDSLLAKLIVHGTDRADAIAKARRALDAFVVEGVATTREFLSRVLDEPAFRRVEHHARWIDELTHTEATR